MKSSKANQPKNLFTTNCSFLNIILYHSSSHDDNYKFGKNQARFVITVRFYIIIDEERKKNYYFHGEKKVGHFYLCNKF